MITKLEERPEAFIDFFFFSYSLLNALPINLKHMNSIYSRAQNTT